MKNSPNFLRAFLLRFISILVGLVFLFFIEIILQFTNINLIQNNKTKILDISRLSDNIFVKNKRLEGNFITTNPDWVGLFNYQEFQTPKKKSTFRIFCFGGSSTYGYPFGASLAWPRWLQFMLEKTYPNQEFEVINAGADCYSSTRILTLAKECINFQPDLFIIYSGNNEFLEPHFFNKPNLFSLFLIKVNKLSENFFIYKILRFFYEDLTDENTWMHSKQILFTANNTKDKSHFVTVYLKSIKNINLIKTIKNRIAFKSKISNQNRKLTYALYQHNLSEIALLGRNNNIPILFLTVPVNLSDWVPNLSWNPDKTSLINANIQVKKQEEAFNLMRKKELKKSKELLKSILNQTPQNANAHFLLGCIYKKLEKFNSALNEFEKARDYDLLPLRATKPMNKIVRQIANKYKTGFVDMEILFKLISPNGLTGKEYFWDMCHPLPKGHKFIASSIIKWINKTNYIDFHFKNSRKEMLPKNHEKIDMKLPISVNSPWSADMIAQMGYLLECLDRFSRAKDHYKYALSIDPNNETARAGISRIYLLDNEKEFPINDPFQPLREKIDSYLIPKLIDLNIHYSYE